MADLEENEKPDVAKSMDDTMRETMENIKSRDSGEASAEKTVEQPAKAEADLTKSANQKDEKTGRFKGKQAAESAAKPQEITVDPAKEGAAPLEAKPQKAASQAPSSWSPAAKAKWDSLDPAIRAEVLKRESDAQRGVQQYAEKAKRLDAIDAVVQPKHRQQLTGHYGSFENGIKELLTLSDFAGENPYGFVSYFMQQRNLDPQQLLQTVQRGMPAAQVKLPQAPQAANPLEARLAALESGIQKSQHTTIESTIKSFMSEADDKGQPLHPYFDELRNDIALHLESGKNLQEAYDAAVWASPAHREQMLQAQREQTEAVQKPEMEKQAKQARQAATVVNVTRPNAGATPTKATNWEDTLRANHKRITSGAAA